MKEFDVIVIGAGSGLDIASAYANRGKEVAVVEPGPLGGTCLNRGCIPSKMLIHHADVIQTVRESGSFHVDAEVNSINFEAITEEVNKTVSEDAESIENAVESSDRHTLYRTEAEFVDEKVLDVDGEEITADYIFVAAGSRPLVPPVEGLESVNYLTSKEALKLDEKPDELVVIGGGYIAVELAHFFNAVGTEVKIIEMGDSLVKREDREVSEKFTELASEKYSVNLGLKASRVEQENDQITVHAEDMEGNEKQFSGDELLVAAGRVPNTDSLNVEEAGIKTTETGFIETNEYLETSVEGVYALGDIADNWMFKHAANHEAEIAFKNSLTENSHSKSYEAMPHAIFSSPQISGVGKTEQQLEQGDTEYVKASYDYRNTGMGLALKEEDGFVKVLASEKGEILGCHIIGPEASSIIHEVLVVMNAGTGNVKDIKDTIHIHPALNEVVHRAFNQL
mgnify:FL=1